MKGFTRWSGVTCLVFLVLVACADDGTTDPDSAGDDDGTVIGSVDADGGTITSGDVSLIVPAGAVDGSVEIRMDPATNAPASSGLVDGTAYDFGPDGLQFDEPVTLTLPYDPAALPGGATETSLGLYRASGSSWQEVAWVDVDTATNVVRAQISSFSVYAILAGRIENVAGSWEVVSTEGPNTCGDPVGVEETYSVEIEQDGADIVVYIGDLEFDGVVDGSEVDWSGSYPEDGGTTTNSIHVTITPGGDSFSGTSTWSWTGPGENCSGEGSFEGARQ